VNVLAAYVPDSPTPSLTWGSESQGTLVPERLHAFLRQIPQPAMQPLVVMLDNGSMHGSKTVQAAQAALRRERIYQHHLPSYSPELIASGPLLGVIKQYDLPERRHTSAPAIDVAFGWVAARLLTRTTQQLERSD